MELLLQRSRIWLTVIGVFSIFQTFSQTNGPCPGGGATPLALNATCVNQAFSVNWNGTGQTVNASCATGTAYEDGWMQFTGTGNTITVTVSGANRDVTLAAFTGCGGAGEVACNNVPSGTTGSISFPSILGQIYRIQIQRRSGTNNQNLGGNICAIDLPNPPPVNDEPCNAIALTATASCTFATYTNENATASAGVPAPGCASYSGGDVWFTVTVPAGGVVTVDMSQGVITDAGMAIYSGTCGSLTLIECDDDDSNQGLMSLIALSGQTPGATLWIRVWEYGNNNNGTFDICATLPGPPPPNDECVTATPAPVNPDNLCGSVVSGTISGATASFQGPGGCAGADDDDVWYSFVATNTTHYIDIQNITNGTTDLYHSVFSGTCGSLSAPIVCSDPNNSVLTGLTIGATYYVRIYSWTAAPNQGSNFDLCIGTPPPPPANDDCPGAIPVTVSTSGCTYTTGSIASATMSPEATGCGGTADDDVWYSFVATSTDVQIDLTNITGGTTDLYHSVYAGTCGSIGAALVCSDPNSSQVDGLTVGNTYYVRIYSWTGTAGQTSVFDLCISEIGPCGVTSTTEDYCPYPAILTQGPGSWTSSTYPYYTSDLPANSGSLFCGSVENNSWYQFTALSTTETFNFSVSNCVNNSGIQAQVYDVTNDVNGCCSNFASVSNCWNPGTMTNGTVTANSLTIGNTYILMVDGYAGDNCDFTVTGWTATGIQLPVELVELSGITLPSKNVLTWKTIYEQNNLYFKVMRSYDGQTFENIGIVSGAGTTSSPKSYSFEDKDIRTGAVYYQLIQVDLDGTENPTSVIALDRSIDTEGLLATYPNPVRTVLYVDVNGLNGDVVELRDIEGSTLESRTLSDADFTKLEFNIANLASGVYFVIYRSTDGLTSTEKIIKN